MVGVVYGGCLLACLRSWRGVLCDVNGCMGESKANILCEMTRQRVMFHHAWTPAPGEASLARNKRLSRFTGAGASLAMEGATLDVAYLHLSRVILISIRVEYSISEVTEATGYA